MSEQTSLIDQISFCLGDKWVVVEVNENKEQSDSSARVFQLQFVGSGTPMPDSAITMNIENQTGRWAFLFPHVTSATRVLVIVSWSVLFSRTRTTVGNALYWFTVVFLLLLAYAIVVELCNRALQI